MTYIVLHVLGGLFMTVLFGATGFLLEKLVRGVALAAVNRWVRRIALGAAIWIYVMFVLAAARLLAYGTVMLLCLAVFCAATVVVVRGRRLRLVRPAGFSGTVVGALTLPSFVLAAALTAALSPDVGWDAGAYHLALPKLFIAHRGFVEVPFSVYSNFPLNVQLLHALAMVIQDFVLAKLLAMLFLVLLCVAVYHHARTAHSALAAALAVSLLLANEVVLWEATVAYVDLAYALFCFLAFVMAMQYLDDKRDGSLVMTGVFCGVVAGIKINGIFAVLSIGAVVVASLLLDRKRAGRPDWRGALRAGGVLAMFTTALMLPWLVKNYIFSGNPVYPLFFAVFGGRYWSASLNDQFLTWQRSIGMGRDISDYLLLPARIFLEADWDYGHFLGRLNTIWIVIVPVTLLFVRHVTVRRCLAVAGIFFCLWAATTQEIRYLIPVMPMLACAGGIALAGFVTQVSKRMATAVGAPREAIWFVVALMTIGAVQASLLWTARDTFRQARALLKAAASPEGVRLEASVPEGFRFVNAKLPASAKVMLLNTNQGFFLDREYVADSFFEASQIGERFWQDPTPAGAASVMANLGITHVLVYAPQRFRPDFPPSVERFLNDPRSVKLLYSSPDRDYTVLEIRGP